MSRPRRDVRLRARAEVKTGGEGSPTRGVSITRRRLRPSTPADLSARPKAQAEPTGPWRGHQGRCGGSGALVRSVPRIQDQTEPEGNMDEGHSLGETGQPQPVQQQTSEVVVNDSEALPSYSNFCRVIATPEEAILD